MEETYQAGAGAGATTSMLSVWQRTEDLEARSLETQVEQNQMRQELKRLVFGFAAMDEVVSETGGDSVE